MSKKSKEFYKKHREVILYLVFGAFTTVVSLLMYYLTFVVAQKALGISLENKQSGTYIAVYSVAQILQWVSGVVFAFVTNKKWVFTDSDKSIPLYKQLGIFATGRVATFFLDYGLTYVGVIIFNRLLNGADYPVNIVLDLFGHHFGTVLHINAEFISKVIVSVIVVVTNYFISKIFVFRKAKNGNAISVDSSADLSVAASDDLPDDIPEGTTEKPNEKSSDESNTDHTQND